MGKWKKGLNTQNSPKGSRGDRRWTLLFIGDRSRTVAFNHLKAAIIFTAIVILTLAGISLGLGYLYRNAIMDIRSLKGELEDLNKKLSSLRDDKDLLLAKLVMAESRDGGLPERKEEILPDMTTGSPSPEPSENDVADPPSESQAPLEEAGPLEETGPLIAEDGNAVYHKVESGDSLYLISLSYGVSLDLLRQYNDLKEGNMIRPGQMLLVKPGTGTEAAPAQKAPPVQKAVSEQPRRKMDNRKSEATMKVAADNLTTVIDAGANMMRVEYVLRNTGEKTRPISGQTVIVLKDDGQDPENWLVLPSVQMESGRPKGTQGYSFSIYNYRTIRFKVVDQPATDRFNEAVVYVFTAAGDLVLEKKFSVRISGGRPSPTGT